MATHRSIVYVPMKKKKYMQTFETGGCYNKNEETKMRLYDLYEFHSDVKLVTQTILFFHSI
jgi:hypothetical protein